MTENYTYNNMKINVNLYGTFDKKSKCHAEIVYCDNCENCSLYKIGKCLNVSKPILVPNCKFGKINKITGYTTKSVKYNEFCRQYKDDEKYNLLKYPVEWRVVLVNNTVLLNLTYSKVTNKHYNNFDNKWEETDEYKVEDVGLFGVSEISYVPIQELTSDIINSICKFNAVSLNGNKINTYQDKIVPNFLYELKKLLPDIYNKAINDYPYLSEYQPNFKGKYAYVYSLRDGIEFIEGRNKFVKQDNKLICNEYHSAFLPFHCDSSKIILDITATMYIEITDNSMVDENTIFK